MFETTKYEEEVLSYWKANQILQSVRAKNKGGKPFYFLDGPPFVTGDLHPGQMWVKTLKDVMLRYKRYRGFDVRDKAGFDVHGLPIENKVEKSLNLTSKREIEQRPEGISDFIKNCLAYVQTYMGRMDADYERFAMTLDFSNPYLPYKVEYIESAWSIFKLIHSKKSVYKSNKTTPYCTHCQTAVSQGTMEVEYKSANDPSIFVAFPINLRKSTPRIELPVESYLVIYTTTPWTIPANVAIAVNPKERYVIAKFKDKNLVIAKPRLEDLSKKLGEKLVPTLEFYGSELEGVYYRSPLEKKIPEQKSMQKYHRVIFAEELVSMEEGSGLVHIAPGHGLEDYQIGKKNKLPIFSPVAQNAEYGEEAGEYKGVSVPLDANALLQKELESLGVLLWKGNITHSYPHCWRCDNKIIYIATDQWFFNIQKIKKKLIKENEKVHWHPSAAASWQADVLKNSPDWCISRQRYWGIPIPVWICERCDSEKVVGSLEELKSLAKEKENVQSLIDPSNAHRDAQIHRPFLEDKVHLTCVCGGTMKKIPDVFDVWFDSSIAFRASLSESEFKELFPIDYIHEGKDQLRGWFSGLLKIGVLAYGKRPFDNIGVGGMLLSEDGREMHKKLGNYISMPEILKITSADSFRLWATSHTPWLDLQFLRPELKDSERTVIILHNIANLLEEYQNLLGYRPERKSRISASRLENEEKWILSRLESTVQKATASYDAYEPFEAAIAIKNFINEDFSRFYLKIAKKKLALYGKGKSRKIIDVISYVLYRSLIILSPITPFVAESIYLKQFKMQPSISFESWPKANKKLIAKELEEQFDVATEAITAILSSREKAGIKLRWPIMSATIEVTTDSAYNSLERLASVVEDYTNAKKLDLKRVEGTSDEVRPNFAKLGPSFKQNASAVAEALKGANADELRKAVEQHGSYSLHTSKGPFEITADHFNIVQKVVESDAINFKYGRVTVDKTVNKELKEEALIREFERRVQMMRKEFNLKKQDRIHLGYLASGEMAEAIGHNLQKLKKKLNAASMKAELSNQGLSQDFDIEGEVVKISISKINKT